MGNFKEDIAACEAIILDVDGVLTNGGIIPMIDGDFIRQYNAKDGYALAYAIKEGYKICIISGGRGQSLLNRLTMLGIKHVYIDCMDKIAAINDFCAKTGVNLENVVYMGDDIPDLDCMKLVGIPVAPADAVMEVIEVARYVSEYKGGCGCVRDIIEQVLRAKGDWAKHTGGVTGSDVASR
ncbi:MAG: HAD hydrolase family protein [Rikenellaceae bacterium]